MAYSRVTEEERNHIHRWRQEGLGVRVIAARLSRSPSSICRELARNTGLRGYRPKQAHRLAQERALRPGPRRFTEDVRLDAVARLREGWTPEIISGRARLEGRPWVCKETIYKHVYVDAKLGGDLWTHLPRSRRKRRRRCLRQEGRGRGRIPNQRMIDTRPASVGAQGGREIAAEAARYFTVCLSPPFSRAPFALSPLSESQQRLQQASTKLPTRLAGTARVR